MVSEGSVSGRQIDLHAGRFFRFCPTQRLLGSIDLALAVPHGGIGAALGEQFLMTSALGNHAFIKHDDLICIDDG